MAHPTLPQAARFATLEVMDDASGTNTATIAGVREFGDIGGEANLVAVDEFGRARQRQIVGQQSPSDFSVTFNWDGSTNQQSVFSAGNTGSGTITLGGTATNIADASTYWRLTIKDSSASGAANTTLVWQGGVAAAQFTDIGVSSATGLSSTISIAGDVTLGTT